ncbi:hypothetical protein BGW36DRAFT_389553 [Talaromyces proteolyticus]|uniref:Uncharacterized protein n=1 Tax=Talaromyces proteolyticus TaxID=1131652 RepID=A0AAD4PVN4_9EURO|nr:uncharacterized protein BGW36DRAFT_389553 [Talaromyces proteolyticus]KAH8690893.1 hypothetical protein BGW36DRAFT_389553 [Talaromyces proteolyticus]
MCISHQPHFRSVPIQHITYVCIHQCEARGWTAGIISKIHSYVHIHPRHACIASLSVFDQLIILAVIMIDWIGTTGSRNKRACPGVMSTHRSCRQGSAVQCMVMSGKSRTSTGSAVNT